MIRKRFSTFPVSFLVACFLALLFTMSSVFGQKVTGETKLWHPITIHFEGPECSELGKLNPFTAYRLDLQFTHIETKQRMVVPGYFAADGNAAESGADAGNVWRVHFNPPRLGEWSWAAKFVDASGAEAGYMHGRTGTFTVTASNKTGRDFRAHGRLVPRGRFLYFAGTGKPFYKVGADAPENLLAYADFDGDFKSDGEKDNLIKTWAPHVKDWRTGDPSWQGGKGKGLIGAVNYLAGKGMNAMSFLTLNIVGDDRNVFPYVTDKAFDRIDVSRMAQWEIVFAHAQSLGVFLHFKTQEAENQTLLDKGRMGAMRALYYRELVARFGHHNALNWNLGEENGSWGGHRGKQAQTTEDRIAMVKWFAKHDPYKHHVIIHNGQLFDDLLGAEIGMTGLSLQTNQTDFKNVYPQARRWLDRSAKAGFPWAIACDEPGDAQHALRPDSEDPTHREARINALWGIFMAGGWGIEWYFGYKHAHSDLTCQDWRSRDEMWDQSRHALDLITKEHIPLPRMLPNNRLCKEWYRVLAGQDGKKQWVMLSQLMEGGTISVDLGAGEWTGAWLNPRDASKQDLKTSMTGPQSLKAPDTKDWLLLLRQTNPGPKPKMVKEKDPKDVFLKGENLSSNSKSGTSKKASSSKEPSGPLPVVSLTKGRSFVERDGLIVGEAEHARSQSKADVRRWYPMAGAKKQPTPDGDPSHASTASGGEALEILPDTRRTHADKLIHGENFSPQPGKMAILEYPIQVKTAGRWYVWVRAHSSGGEDNGIHVGLNGDWPESGQRMQWCEGKRDWRWESKQRTDKNHCGEAHKIFLDIKKPGAYVLQFSMREDGFEFDKWLMTQDRMMKRPTDAGPRESSR